MALHRAGKAHAERLRRKLQRTPARRVSERDAIHLAHAGARGYRGMASGLQRRQTAFSHRLADASRTCRSVRPAMGHAAAYRRLRGPAHCYDSADGENQPPDSSRNWIRLGGNVTTIPEMLPRSKLQHI